MGGGPNKDHLLCIVPFPEPEGLVDHLRRRFPSIDVTWYSISSGTVDPDHPSNQVPPSLFNPATVLATLSSFPRKLSDAPNLELVHLFSAGSNQVEKHPLYTDSDVTITTSSGIHGPQIAEWALVTHLVLTHKYNLILEQQKQHKWDSSRLRAVQDRVGLRLGVLGYGSIGRQIGRVAHAMGMDVVAYTATPKDTPEKKKDRGFIVPGTGDADGSIPVEWYSGLDKKSLRNFLAQNLDWLVVSVPLTKETRGFLSTEEFEVLGAAAKNGKPLVTNIARGPIVDTAALTAKLKDDTLGGAALDVTDPEPLPADSELWDMENVIISPHVSGSGLSYVQRSFQLLEANLERREKGEKLINVVRRERGY